MPQTAAPTNDLVLALIRAGRLHVAGVDEVGRGCWAGPVTAAAVVLEPHVIIEGVRDSKRMTNTQRVLAAARIKQAARAVGIGWASAAEVDRHGLTWAVRASSLRALKAMRHRVDAVILDGGYNFLADVAGTQAVPKADGTCLSVAAASVVAKVARDRYMRSMHIRYPGFGFDSHKGYGTGRHAASLAGGVSPIHRRSYRPVANALGKLC